MNSIAILCVIGSYLVGSVPFGLLLSRGSGIDIRSQGSKNIGATNVTRLLGKKRGALTLLCDLLKGIVPMVLASLLLRGAPQSEIFVGVCGLAAVLGHMFPLYLRFHGGKGVATSLGVFLFLQPLAVLGCVAVFVLSVRLSGFVSLGSLFGSISILLWLWLLNAPGWMLLLGACIVGLIWFKHYPNIQRLLKGQETSWKKQENS